MLSTEEVRSAYAQWEMKSPSRALMERMTEAGFEMQNTGGNVWMWMGKVQNTDLSISLTHVEDGPPERLSDPVYVSVYDGTAGVLGFVHPELSTFLKTVDGIERS